MPMPGMAGGSISRVKASEMPNICCRRSAKMPCVVSPCFSRSLNGASVTKATPVFGALAGASINYTFARYYQELARVQFGLLRLSRESGLPREALVEALGLRIEELRDKRPARPARKS